MDSTQATSTTGGKKISSQEAAEIFGVSTTTLYAYMRRGLLFRAGPYREDLRRQKAVFYLADVVALALKFGVITQEQANRFLGRANQTIAA